MKIERVLQENCPAAVFIGKRYPGPANWSEWWANGWFDTLENLSGALPINDNGYIEAIRSVDGCPEHWLGMFFAVGTAIPVGFDCVEIPSMKYAVCYLYGDPGGGELFDTKAHEECLSALKEQGLRHKEGDWCFQRCNCPRFTTPDACGNVVLDYGISMEN